MYFLIRSVALRFVLHSEFQNLQYDPIVFVLLQRYLDEAEREKMQYAQELKEYQQTEAYQITSAKIQDKKMRKGDTFTLHQ